MKKILSVLLVCVMIFGTGTTVFASGQSTNGSNAGQKSGAAVLNGQNSEANKEAKEALAQAREQIRLNHDEIFHLRESIRDCADELRLQIRDSIENTENLTPEEIAVLKEALQQMKQDREQFRLGHQGKVAEQVALMKQARIGRDWNAAQFAMDKIQEEQQLRIEDLTEMLSEMQDVLDTLTD